MILGNFIPLLTHSSRAAVWGPARLLYTVGSEGLRVAHPDPVGTIVSLTDASGAVSEVFRLDIFGERRAGGTEGSHYPLRYTGELYDPASELVYLRARQYLPTIGRFRQRDTFSG